jgi:hypothetical protein
MQKLDTALQASGQSISELLRFKYSLAQNGLLPPDRQVAFPQVTEKYIPWNKRFQ